MDNTVRTLITYVKIAFLFFQHIYYNKNFLKSQIFCLWCHRVDLNHWPSEYEADALTTWATVAYVIQTRPHASHRLVSYAKALSVGCIFTLNTQLLLFPPATTLSTVLFRGSWLPLRFLLHSPCSQVPSGDYVDYRYRDYRSLSQVWL